MNPLPHWYPDPTNRYEMRYWDGSRWTDHVASAGVTAVDALVTESIPLATRQRPGRISKFRPSWTHIGIRHLGWAGLIIAVVGGVIIGVVGADIDTGRRPGVNLNGSTQHVHLPAHQKYGIYIDDENNSGYSEDCSAVDSEGRSVRLKDPSWSISSSDTETLDLVFDTGSGVLTFNCSVPGERVTAKPVSNPLRAISAVAAAGILECAGVTMIVVWLVFWIGQRRSRT